MICSSEPVVGYALTLLVSGCEVDTVTVKMSVAAPESVSVTTRSVMISLLFSRMCSTWKLSVLMTGPMAGVTLVPMVVMSCEIGVVPPVPVAVRSIVAVEPAVVMAPV